MGVVDYQPRIARHPYRVLERDAVTVVRRQRRGGYDVAHRKDSIEEAITSGTVVGTVMVTSTRTSSLVIRSLGYRDYSKSLLPTAWRSCSSAVR